MTFQQDASRLAGHAARGSLLAPLDEPAPFSGEPPLTDRIGAILGRRQIALDMPPQVEAMPPAGPISRQAEPDAQPVPPILSGLGWVLGGAGLCGCLLAGLWLAMVPGQGSSFDVASAPPAAAPAQAEPAIALSPTALSELDTVKTASVPKADPAAAAPVAPDAQRLAETQSLKDELARLRVEQAQAQKRIADQSAAAGAITLAGLVGGTFPAELLTPPLDDLRRRYADARLVVDQLTQALGPRHPRLQAAQGQADVLKADLERELRGLATDARLSLQQEQKKAQALAARNAELTAALRQAPAAVPASKAQAQDAALVTASIPAAAARPPAEPAPVFQQSAQPMPEEQPLPPAIDTETTPGGLMAILGLALATGAAIVGLSRLGRRRLGLAQEPAAPMPAMPSSDAGEPAEAAMAAPPMTDLADLRLEVAALRQRLQDFSERRYRQSA